MYDPAIVGVQLPNCGRLTILFGFLGGPCSEVLKILPFLGKISTHINAYPYPFAAVAVNNFFDEVLDGFKGLAAFANENSGPAAFDLVIDAPAFIPRANTGTWRDARCDFS